MNFNLKTLTLALESALLLWSASPVAAGTIKIVWLYQDVSFVVPRNYAIILLAWTVRMVWMSHSPGSLKKNPQANFFPEPINYI